MITLSRKYLYATYQTEGATPEFWKNLARENQLDFKASGSAGKCIEGREFIIALPESFVQYRAGDVVRLFTETFHKRYGVECSAALHHNKTKTNYHIHLVFSERKMLEQECISGSDDEWQTEQLKADNALEWGGRMNNIQACAREIVDKEIIYQ